MQNPVRAFICSGLLPVLSLVWPLTGCAVADSLGIKHEEPASFVVEAMRASPVQRERLWKRHRSESRSEFGLLRIAVLESLPSHSGYNPDQADRDLRKLANLASDGEIRSIAQLRRIELDSQQDCLKNQAALQSRLDQIVDIERKLDKDDAGKPSNSRR